MIDKKGKGKAAVKDDEDDEDGLVEQDDPDAMWVDRFAPRNRVRPSSSSSLPRKGSS